MMVGKTKTRQITGFAAAIAAAALAAATARADWTLAKGSSDGLKTTMTDSANHTLRVTILYEYDEATSCNPRFAGDISLLDATSLGGSIISGAGNVKSVTIGENLTSLTASGAATTDKNVVNYGTFAGMHSLMNVTFLGAPPASGIPASTFSSYYYPRRLERSFRP